MIYLEIPDEIVQQLRFPPDRVEMELKRELALHLVRERICTLAQGARLAEMDRLEFERFLGSRHVPWPGTLDDIRHDLEVLERP
jgi:predicted HTH domain antitoxin